MGSIARTSIPPRGHHEATVRRARRQPLHASPRRTDLLVPRHIRIDHMLEFPVPHMRSWPGGCSGSSPSARCDHAVRVTVQHHQRRRAGRMRCREQRSCRRTHRRPRGETASRLPRSSSTAVMLSAHCSRVGSAPGVTGSEAPVPGWSKKMSRPSDVIASTHPWREGSSGRSSQHVNQFGQGHDVASTFARRAIGDTQIPVQRIARLREHRRSLSPERAAPHTHCWDR